MKSIVRFIVFTVAILVCKVCAVDPIVRFPLVTESFSDEIGESKGLANEQAYPDHYWPDEASWSNPYSSGQGSYDIYVVKTADPSGGRILKSAAIPTTESGIAVIPTFVDVVSGQSFTPYLETQDNRNGQNDWDLTPEGYMENYYHYGSFEIGTEVIYVLVGYYGSLRSPSVMLTWGEGANVGHPGAIIDSFGMVDVGEPVTMTSSMVIFVPDDPEYAETIFVSTASPLPFGKVELETSTDMKTWRRLDVAPSFIFGEHVTYAVPKSKFGLFRAVELK